MVAGPAEPEPSPARTAAVTEMVATPPAGHRQGLATQPPGVIAAESARLFVPPGAAPPLRPRLTSSCPGCWTRCRSCERARARYGNGEVSLERDTSPLIVSGLGARWIAGEDYLVRSYLPGAGKPVAGRNDPTHRRQLTLASTCIGRATLPLLLQPSVRAETTIAADSSPGIPLKPRSDRACAGVASD